ncbi:MAG: hypothetical protein U0U70_13980 [Chitinophagaceae bacterium]
MKIRNIAGLSAAGLEQEAANGARFVHYTYTVSFLFGTIKKDSPVYMIRPGERNQGKRTWYIFLSAVFGWWGLPSGPKKTIDCIRTNIKGGKDVTDEVMSTVAGHILFQQAQKERKARAV